MNGKALNSAPSDWERKSIANVCKNISSGGTPSRRKPDYFSNGTIPWIKTQELNDWFIYETEEKISELAVKESAAKVLPKNTLLIAMYGATVGQLGILSKPMACNQACCALCVDENAVDFRYLFYQLLFHKDQFKNLAVGAAQQNLNTIVIKNFVLPFPPLAEQRAIADVLSALDDKIELNRRMNQTLEELAQTLFKHMYIKHEAERKDIKRLIDYIDCNIAGDWGNETKTRNFSEEVYCIRGTDIPTLAKGSITRIPTRYIKTENLEKKKVIGGDIIIELSGGSPTQSTGRSTVVLDYLIEQIGAPLVCSNFCRIIRLKEKKYSLFFDLLLNHVYKTGLFFQYENGTTGIKNLAFEKFAEQFCLSSSFEAEIEQFNSVVFPLYQKTIMNARESYLLANLRDTLLPRLMSGQVRVKL